MCARSFLAFLGSLSEHQISNYVADRQRLRKFAYIDSKLEILLFSSIALPNDMMYLPPQRFWSTSHVILPTTSRHSEEEVMYNQHQFMYIVPLRYVLPEYLLLCVLINSEYHRYRDTLSNALASECCP
jgi:hypothetical protein